MVVGDCWMWIPALWSALLVGLSFTRKQSKDVVEFCDDITIEILSRLPAESVLKCRMVCKRWMTLTSTPQFHQLHLLRASPPLFVIVDYGGRWWPHIFFYSCQEKDNRKKIKPVERYAINPANGYPCGCWNGLLVFQSDITYYVYNPITLKYWSFQLPLDAIFGALYFHNLSGEFRVIYAYACRRRLGDYLFQFMIHSIATRSRRPLALLPCIHLSDYLCFICPVLANENFHWVSAVSNQVIKFNIHTEELVVMPHPDVSRERILLELEISGSRLSELDGVSAGRILLEMDGLLALCDVNLPSIDIWILVDYADWSWIKKGTVNLQWVTNYHTRTPRPIGFDNGELLVFWYGAGRGLKKKNPNLLVGYNTTCLWPSKTSLLHKDIKLIYPPSGGVAAMLAPPFPQNQRVADYWSEPVVSWFKLNRDGSYISPVEASGGKGCFGWFNPLPL